MTTSTTSRIGLVISIPAGIFQNFIGFICMMLMASVFLGCNPGLIQTRKQIRKELAKQPGTFAVAYKNLSTGEKILIREKESFPAASTMKTPVMIEVFKQASRGEFSLFDSMTVKDEFQSIADGSRYALDPVGDSDPGLYQSIGKKETIYQLTYRMITSSSNLSTNLLIEKVGAANVTQTMHELGAVETEVLRGVEDQKAFEANLINSTTAADLMIIFEELSDGTVVSVKDCEAMIKILLEQKFSEVIPAKLPTGIQVAHKTGNYAGVRHDSGIVIIPDGRRYVLVILSKNLTNDQAAIDAMANVSRLIYRRAISRK